MRSILGILLLLIGIGLLSCRIEGRSADVTRPMHHPDWVRTVDGWEQPRNWTTSFARPPAVHPLVVAAGQTLLSLFALVTAARLPIRQTRGTHGPIQWSSRRANSSTTHQKQSR
jgi:hypothetical protein